MDSAFLHYEILGPRATMEHWLESVQDLGSCHVADALRGIEGEAGIGRPAPTLEEWEAELLRSEAAVALRGVARVLPPTARRSSTGGLTADRPLWHLEPGAVDERDLLALRDEAVALAERIRARLEASRAAETKVEELDAVEAGAHALVQAGADTVDGQVLFVPRSAGTSRRSSRRVARRLKRAKLEVLRAEGTSTRVVVVPTSAGTSDTADTAIRTIAQELGVRLAAFPERVRGVTPPEAVRALATERTTAERADAEARAALRARIAEDGARARLLLDSIEDAERRRNARRLLASTAQVVALRVYVRREDDADLREHLQRTWGEAVVIRPLAGAPDGPSLPRSAAPVPLSALRGLLPRHFGEVPMPSVLALFTPLATAAVLADVAGGLLILLVGALLGVGSGRGSARRDTALLAQSSGLIALTFGMLAGRAFGPLGIEWFGGGWGLASGLLDSGFSFAAGGPAGFVLGVGAVLGQVAGAIALWGVGLALWNWAGGRVARGRATFVAALDYVCVAALAFSVTPGALLPALWIGDLLWIAVPIAIGLRLLLAGPRRLIGGLALDLVAVLRLVAVAGAALALFGFGFDRLVSPAPEDLVLAPIALLVAAFAVVVDPAHMAMGVPYDLSLGGRRFSRPFAPFERRMRTEGI